MAFRPPFWATILTLAGIAGLLALGTWQVKRLYWKQDILSRLAQAYESGDLPRYSYRDLQETSELTRVRVRGAYDHSNEILIQPRTWQGQAGYHVVTPLELGGADFLLVNRGWIPQDRRAQASRPESLTEGPVEVTGLLRVPDKGNPFTPANRPAENIWFSISPAQLAAKAGPVLPLILYADAETGNPPLPVREALRWQPPNNHAGYALFWYSMALVLAVIYYLRFIRK